MLNSSINYPYPVLRGSAVDYKTTTFAAEITKHEEKDGFVINVHYHTSNAEILSLIEQKKAAFALQIQCTSTWYRSIEKSESEFQEIKLLSNMVHERVEMCPCIIACEPIDKFFNTDFSDDFKGITFCINSGEVIAIGEREQFVAIYEDDIIKKGDSIVHFVRDERSSVMFCEYDYDIIRIHLPKQQYENYNNIGKNEHWKVPSLNAIYVVPAIVMAVEEICKDICLGGSGEFEQRPWYKTLQVLIRKRAKDNNEYTNLLNDPIKTTQLLLNDNSTKALDVLLKSIKQ